MIFAKKLSFWLLLTGLLVGMPGCSKKIQQVNNRSSYRETKEQISVRAKKLTAQECTEEFTKNIVSYGYQPIQLTIVNESDDALLLRASSFDIPLERPETVFRAAQIPSLVLTLVPAYCAALFYWPLIAPIAGIGFWMGSRNQTIAERIGSHALSGDVGIEILPFERLDRVIFVRDGQDLPHFSFHLFNVHKKTFVPFYVEFD